MSRVQTTYYGADTTTQFQWATSGSDQFSRTRDLYYLSQAVEFHDHSNARGLPVARVADGSLTAAAYAALSIPTAALANLCVTTGKINAGAVSRDKLATPLVQASNDAAGGMQLADSTSTYTGSFFVDAIGSVCIATGVSRRFNVRADGKVSVGAGFSTLLPALFAVMQTAFTASDGIRVQDASNDNRRLEIFVDNGSSAYLQTITTSIIFSYGASGMWPLTDNTHYCGHPSLRWLLISTVNLTAPGTVTLGIMTATGGTIGTFVYTTANGGAIVCTTINTQGNGLTMGAGAIGCGAIACTTITGTALVCTTINAQGNTLACGGITCTTINTQGNTISSGAHTATSLSTDSIIPTTSGGGASTNGSVGSPWFNLFATNAFKPGGGSWTVPSDERTKVKSSITPYDRGLEFIKKLEPVYYHYTGEFGLPTDREFVGVTAQKLQQHAPEMVSEIKAHRDPTPDKKTGRPKGPASKILTVDPSNLVYALINAVQELSARIEQLEDRKN